MLGAPQSPSGGRRGLVARSPGLAATATASAWPPGRHCDFHKQLNAGPAAILAERNIEQRRVLMERYDSIHGKGRFIQDVGARVIDSAVQPMRPGEPDQINELLSVDLPGDPEARLVALKVIDPSTGRQYVLRVPPGLTSVRSALAWTFGVSPEGVQTGARKLGIGGSTDCLIHRSATAYEQTEESMVGTV